ncbi:MAG: autotransporter outer membrane beta-barrel domain-containing protein [Planctomycetaceae bacterium]|jgi:hypothetical protein|nr:autotransporter outer membrane beta-barrel domain-containing protein [Planctomycetaceae bacterium]
MKKQSFFTIPLLIGLLVALANVNALAVDVGHVGETGWTHNGIGYVVYAGVQLGTSSLYYDNTVNWLSTTWVPLTDLANIDKIIINLANDVPTGALHYTIAAVASKEITGTFQWNIDIILTGAEVPANNGGIDNVYGFLSIGNGVVGTPSDAFAGTITGKDVTITGAKGEVIGVYFKGGDGANTGKQGISGTVQFDKISVSSEDDGATGFAAGGLTGSVTLKSVEVDSKEDTARWVNGVHFQGDISSTGILTIGDGIAGHNAIVAKTAGTDPTNATATGLLVGKDDGGFIGNVISGTVIVNGNIVVEGTLDAYGIRAGELNDGGSIILNGTTTATSTSGAAYGIWSNGTADDLVINGNIGVNGNGTSAGIRTFGAAKITLDKKDVAITANGDGAGIWTTGGDLTIHLNGKNLTTTSMKVDDSNSMTITGKTAANTATTGDLSVVSGGITLNTATLAVIGSLTTSATTLEKGSKLQLWSPEDADLGEVTFADKKSKIYIYGTAVKGTPIGTLVKGDDIKKIVRQSRTRWGLDEDGKTIISLGGTTDGYLAALSMHSRYAAWNAVRDRLISGSGYGYGYPPYARQDCGYRGQVYDPRNPYQNYDPNPYDPRALYAINGGDAQAWVNYTGRSDAYWSNVDKRNWKTTVNGIQVGTDVWRSRHEQLGVLFGYEEGKTTNSWDHIKMEDPYFGIYGVHVFANGADIRGVFAYGWQKYTMSYEPSFEGNTTEIHIELGKRVAAGPWSLRPVFGVDYFDNILNTAKNWGVDEDTAFWETRMSQVFLRIGTDMRYNVGFLTVNSGLYYSCDVHERAGKGWRTTIENDEEEGELWIGSKPGRSLLTYNLGGDFMVSDSFSIFGGYNGEYAFDRSHGVAQHSGYVGGVWRW